ncbi:hypothetical protein [Micromonospora avicenniae]|uniref:hypothetical protein n=1 Tax=Micromonospora avicenniae TaxID=1198245 RepID=UPI0033228302
MRTPRGRDVASRTGMRRLRAVAAGFVLIGLLGAFGATALFVPAWQAAHVGGRTGSFVLTEPMSCDRWQPPRQRCGWFGDFLSDDGSVVRRDRELAGGLPPGAEVGDAVRARDTGSWTQIYQASDSQGWRGPAGFLAGFAAILVSGLVMLVPWCGRRGR